MYILLPISDKIKKLRPREKFLKKGDNSPEGVSEQICKPGSVFDDHLSRPCVTARLQPFSGILTGSLSTSLRCFGRGLHEAFVTSASVRSYRTFPHLPRNNRGVSFLLHCSLESPQPVVNRRPCPMKPGLSSHGIPCAIV